MADIERMKRALQAADAAGDTEAAAKIAQNIRAARRAQTEDDTSAFEWAGDRARALNTGLVAPIPGARDVLSHVGITYLSGEEPEGIVDRGLQLGGESATYGVAINAALARLAQRGLTAGSGLVQRGMDAIAKTYGRSPGKTLAGETVAGTVAGSSGEAGRQGAESAELPEWAQDAAEVGSTIVGGVASSPRAALRLVPGAVTTAGRRVTDTVAKHVLPMTEAGARPRAAGQMQERAEAPELAAERARNAPEGVTPARASGDERLMAQERRVLEDNPSLDRQVRQDLEAAIDRTERAFYNQHGEPVSRAAWEQRVMNEVAAPGSKPIEAGDSDQMLQRAYDSFGPAYEPARGFELDVRNLGQRLAAATKSPDVFAGEDVRSQVRGWMNSQLKNVAKTRLGEDLTLSSGDLLDLRQQVRTRQRSLANSTSADDRQAYELFDVIEQRLTQTLDEQLPEDAAEALRAVDAQYRQFKIVEDAVFRSGDKPLTPEAMGEAIRRNAQSHAAYARGADQRMRDLAAAGREVETVLGKPDEAKRMVRNLGPEELQSKKAGYARTLYNRALVPDEEGVPRLSGRKLKAELTEYAETGKALGMNDEELGRLHGIADRLVMMQRKSPEAVDTLLEGGLASVIELLGRWTGARSGQKLAGSGLGSALVLAQFMSRKAVQGLQKLTVERTMDMLTDAATDKELYASLLTGATDPIKKQKAAAQKIEAWLLAHAADQTREAEQDILDAAPPDDMPPPYNPQRSAPQGPAGLLSAPRDDMPPPMNGLLQ